MLQIWFIFTLIEIKKLAKVRLLLLFNSFYTIGLENISFEYCKFFYEILLNQILQRMKTGGEPGAYIFTGRSRFTVYHVTNGSQKQRNNKDRTNTMYLKFEHLMLETSESTFLRVLLFNSAASLIYCLGLVLFTWPLVAFRPSTVFFKLIIRSTSLLWKRLHGIGRQREGVASFSTRNS